jgi:hypothetical protein
VPHQARPYGRLQTLATVAHALVVSVVALLSLLLLVGLLLSLAILLPTLGLTRGPPEVALRAVLRWIGRRARPALGVEVRPAQTPLASARAIAMGLPQRPQREALVRLTDWWYQLVYAGAHPRLTRASLRQALRTLRPPFMLPPLVRPPDCWRGTAPPAPPVPH